MRDWVTPPVRPSVGSRSDGPRPSIYAPHEIMDARKTLLFQKQANLDAASAVVADHHDVVVRLELADARGQLLHRHVRRALDARRLKLPRLAHVEQEWLRATFVGEPRRQVRRRDLLHRAQKRNRGGCSALTSGAMTVSNRSVL